MGEQKKPEAPAFDWEAPDAYEKWEQAKADFLRDANSLPREVLEQLNATANFQADRATDAFLKAADAMGAWRELALQAVQLFQAERKAKIVSKLTAALQTKMLVAEAKAREIDAQAAKIIQSQGGKSTALLRQWGAAQRADKIIEAATELLKKHPKGEISGILERQGVHGSRVNILEKLRAHPSGLWKK